MEIQGWLGSQNSAVSKLLCCRQENLEGSLICGMGKTFLCLPLRWNWPCGTTNHTIFCSMGTRALSLQGKRPWCEIVQYAIMVCTGTTSTYFRWCCTESCLAMRIDRSTVTRLRGNRAEYGPVVCGEATNAIILSLCIHFLIYYICYEICIDMKSISDRSKKVLSA